MDKIAYSPPLKQWPTPLQQRVSGILEEMHGDLGDSWADPDNILQAASGRFLHALDELEGDVPAPRTFWQWADDVNLRALEHLLAGLYAKKYRDNPFGRVATMKDSGMAERVASSYMRKTAGGGSSILMALLGGSQAYYKADHIIEDKDTQSSMLFNEVISKLAGALELSTNQQYALSKIQWVVENAGRADISLIRNNVFKAADLLGMRLPSMMFASEGKTATVGTLFARMRQLQSDFTGETVEEALRILKDEGAEGVKRVKQWSVVGVYQDQKFMVTFYPPWDFKEMRVDVNYGGVKRIGMVPALSSAPMNVASEAIYKHGGYNGFVV